MLGTANLLTFSFRAVVVLLLVSVLWISVAEPYNRGVVAIAKHIVPSGVGVRVLGEHIVSDMDRLAEPVTIKGFALHYGLILMGVLVLASVGLGFTQRAVWLAGLGAGVFLLHIVGVGLLAHGIKWISSDGDVTSTNFVFSLYAVFWGLVPAVIGGVWAFKYWLPRATPVADPACQPIG